MGYQLTTVAGRKYDLSAAEYSLLSEYGSEKRNTKKTTLPVVILLGMTLFLVLNPSSVGVAEATKKISHAPLLKQESVSQQAVIQETVEPAKSNRPNRLWVQIELPAN